MSGRFRIFFDRNTSNDVLIWINAWYLPWAAVWETGSQFKNWVCILLYCKYFNRSQLLNHAKGGNSVAIRLNRTNSRCESILHSSPYSQNENRKQQAIYKKQGKYFSIGSWISLLRCDGKLPHMHLTTSFIPAGGRDASNQCQQASNERNFESNAQMKLANIQNISEDSVVSSRATLGTGGTSAARKICSSPSSAIFVCGVRDCVSNYKSTGNSVPASAMHRPRRDCSAQAPRANICSDTDVADRNMRGTMNFSEM